MKMRVIDSSSVRNELPLELQHLDSNDKMLQQVALFNLIAIVESNDEILSPETALKLVKDRITTMDPSSRIQSVEVRIFMIS
jgi:hypothetical protein